MFLPATQKEVTALGWDGLDVILVTGDAYIDSPFIGVAVIGKVLVDAGYRVGIIAQPDLDAGTDICRLGEPRLFWGITAGCIDSMVANRTATGKKRNTDDYTPGGRNDRRPDRAVIAYSNLVRKHFKHTRPIVLGGLEASLRRIAHYDFWSDSIRRSILFDAKADYLLYGMAERSVVELASALRDGRDPTGIRGLCYASRDKPDDAVELPSFEATAKDRDAFTVMFHEFYRNCDPVTARRLAQKHDTRWLLQNPPALHLSGPELDRIYALGYERDLHPLHRGRGEVKALDTISFSITTHRGCFGECNFCAIAVHQGRAVRWRGRKSIIAEAREIATHPRFKGSITDVGGPTANMYGISCSRMHAKGCCPDRRCMVPTLCSALSVCHRKQISLLRDLRKIAGIKRVVVASGIRHDLVLGDKESGTEYLQELVTHHVSGQLKIAPEHSEAEVLEKMGKPGMDGVLKFRDLFNRLTRKAGKNQFLTYYMIAAHPGCNAGHMEALRTFAVNELKLRPEQVQIFTPAPSTYSTLMYWTERDPFTDEPCFVEKSVRGKEGQKAAVLTKWRGPCNKGQSRRHGRTRCSR